MAEEVIFPRVDMDMTEGTIAQWYVRNGESVRKGQIVFEIETDKATMEIEATADGILQGSDGKTGTVVPVGQVVAWILQPGESIPSDGVPAASVIEGGTPVPQAPAVGEAQAVAAPADAGRAAGQEAAPEPAPLLRATPLARSIARERSIDLHAIRGSGPDGRIVAADLPGRQGMPAADALHLHWFRRGAGAPLVLLHGFGTSSGSWRPLAEQLGDVPVLGIDLPNHGKSPCLPVADLDAIAPLLLARLDQEGIEALHLLGHSMGGGAAMALAARLPSRLRSLTLLAPLGLGPHINGDFIQGMLRANRLASLRPWLGALFGDPRSLSGSFAATAWSELASAETRGALATMAEHLLPDGTQATDLRDRLADLDVPVKLIWGARDRIVPPGHAAGLPGSVAVHMLPGIGHLPQVESVALVARLVHQQLAAGNAGRPAPLGARVAPDAPMPAARSA
jgi:pyruvate dehydrogenase E2 component (dihydrolipoamide acetyltransferase)